MVPGGSERQPIGRITRGIERGTLVLRTVGFVQGQLAAWRDDPSRPNEQSEDRLNLQLCKFLDARARSQFPMVCFHHEEYEAGHRSVDLSASPVKAILIGARPHTVYTPFLVLECKRLPTPSLDREREYVTGGVATSGGIQRFKLGLHGAHLDCAAMIAYLQQYTPQWWHDRINRWILELCNGTATDGCNWTRGEGLEPLREDPAEGVASYRSVHARSGRVLSQEIRIYHLWVVMNFRTAETRGSS